MLVMGRPEGPDCYCMANNILRGYLQKITGNYPYVVIDNEAGMEHFSRLTTRDVDLLFVLSDSSRRGIMTAARIRDLVKELKLNIKKDLLVLNRMAGPLQQDTAEEIKKNRLDLAGIIPSDEEINRFDRNGTPTFQLPSSVLSVQAAWHIFEKYIP